MAMILVPAFAKLTMATSTHTNYRLIQSLFQLCVLEISLFVTWPKSKPLVKVIVYYYSLATLWLFSFNSIYIIKL